MRSEKSTQPLTQHVAKKSEQRDKETERREASRTAARERVRKYHEKKQTAAQEDNRMDSPGFANRTSKKRATDKSHSLPLPEKRRKLCKPLLRAHGQGRFYLRVV